MDRSWIQRYAAGADLPAQSIAGLTPQQMLARPVPGTWSIHQIVVHLMDSDLVGGDRMKRVIAEPNPTLLAYDQDAFVQRLDYERLDAHLAAEIFRSHRRMISSILESLGDQEFQRTGMHTEDGRRSLAQLVQVYVQHLDHHLEFLRRKRQMVEQLV